MSDKKAKTGCLTESCYFVVLIVLLIVLFLVPPQKKINVDYVLFNIVRGQLLRLWAFDAL